MSVKSVIRDLCEMAVKVSYFMLSWRQRVSRDAMWTKLTQHTVRDLDRNFFVEDHFVIMIEHLGSVVFDKLLKAIRISSHSHTAVSHKGLLQL